MAARIMGIVRLTPQSRDNARGRPHDFMLIDVRKLIDQVLMGTNNPPLAALGGQPLGDRRGK
jgi:hypothetical protein